jgi:energy-converting hydrogenase Eha subunit B
MYAAVGIMNVQSSYLDHSLDACSTGNNMRAGWWLKGGYSMGHSVCSRLAAAGIGGAASMRDNGGPGQGGQKEAGRWFVDDGLVSRCGHLG